MSTTLDKWFNVNVSARVWSGHSDNHQKMGRLLPGSAIRAIQEYKGSYRFAQWRGPDELVPLNTAYPEYWIRTEDTSLFPYEEDADTPTPPPEDEDDVPAVTRDAKLGAALRLILLEGGEVFFAAG